MRVFSPCKRVINSHSQPTANVGKPGRSVTVDFRAYSCYLSPDVTRRQDLKRVVLYPHCQNFPEKVQP